MTDVEEIIEYIKSLKKGFDKEFFQSKVDELSFAVDNEGLEYEHFHTLFKVWLNLSIPITKWVSLGVCLVPRDRITERTVEYSLRWLMANYENQTNCSRVGFVLDWLTAAMDNDCIDTNSLDSGYEIFYTTIAYESLTAHGMKLVYTLTKPVDVTRRRVIELLDYAKKREGKKNRELQVLLGLFKSFKPECVPEDVPSISIHTSFRKLNSVLVNRFKNLQSHLNSMGSDQQRLFWLNPINSESGRNKNADFLVPNMEFVYIGSKQYADDMQQKSYLDFSDAASLLQGAVHTRLRRPARLRALLANTHGATLLALAPPSDQAFFCYDLHHQLTASFLDISPHSYTEKQYLLSRLSVLQRTLMQGISVVTRFLAQYLHFWNEHDFFAEIMELVEWLSVDDVEQVTSILDSLCKIYCRSQPIEQVAIMKAMTTLFCNLVLSSTRGQQYFISMNASDADYSEILALVSDKISDMCDKGLQANPNDMRVLYSSACGALRRAGAQLQLAAAARGRLAALRLALSLLAPSAALLDCSAALLLLYKQIFGLIKRKHGKDPQFSELKQVLRAYTYDFINCFYEQCLTYRNEGFVFQDLHPQFVSKLEHIVPDANSKFSIRNHLALAPYTYMRLQAIEHSEANNKLLFEKIVGHEFENLSTFVQQSMPDLR